MKEWVKLHTQLLADPKIGTLSWAHRGMWSAMLALAGLIDDRDALDLETGKLDTLENVAWHLRCEVEMLAGALAELTRRGMVDDRDGILYITDYGKRQARPPSASREAIAGRVRRCRARKQRASPAGDEGQAGGSRSPPRVRGDSRGSAMATSPATCMLSSILL